ncbi:MAG: murein transglycosylase [Alphaproteobacteria bacterium]|nr:murein transglycosylase [Alphaproteobacteria bacterium]
MDPRAPRVLTALGLAALLGACALPGPAPTAPARLTLEPAAFADLPGWATDDAAAALPALLKSCARLARAAGDNPLDPAGVMGRPADWRQACDGAARVPAGDARAARRFFEDAFRPWRGRDTRGSDAFFTGYYEASLRGSRTRDSRYRHPIHRPPADLVSADLSAFRPEWRGETLAGRIEKGKLVPYHDRAAIERGALTGRGLEILWVDDPADAFFLHVQGSGRVVLPDGKTVRLGFAARNGHAYTSIGRVLAEQGAMTAEQATMQSLRAWIAANPAAGAELMRRNKSYIFFRELSGDASEGGPVGASGVALTPERSLAVDPAFIPHGAPVWIATGDPLDAGRPLRRLAVAQDSGAAIKGPLRVDIFFGAGAAAADRAGAMKHRGELFVLRPRHLPPP